MNDLKNRLLELDAVVNMATVCGLIELNMPQMVLELLEMDGVKNQAHADNNGALHFGLLSWHARGLPQATRH